MTHLSWQASALLFCGWMFLWLALCVFGWKWILRRNRNRMINLPPPSQACRRNSTEALP
jgi:hypothetical protein